MKKTKRTYEEIIKAVPLTVESSRGIITFKDAMVPYFFSKGIEAMIDDYGMGAYECVANAMHKFVTNDFGSPDGADSIGCYPGPLGNTPETGAIMVRLEPGFMTLAHVIVYLKFEEY